MVVTSAGCDWYIRILLDEAGVTLPVWSNPGRFEEGRGLLMELYQVRKIRAFLFHGLCRLGKIDWASESHQELDRCLSRAITASKNFND